MTGVARSMDHKEPQVSPTVQVVEDRKLGKLGKHQTWACAAVLVSLFVVGAIVAVVVVSLHYTQDRVKERSVSLEPEKGVKINETIRVNVDKRTEEFDIKDQGMKIMHDFEKGLTVYRMPDGHGSHYCVLTWLEMDKIRSPEDTYAALNEEKIDRSKIQAAAYDNSTDDEDEDESSTIWYDFSNANVEDRKFLGDDMKAACANNDLFWAIKSNKPVMSQEKQIRKKRWFFRFRRVITWIVRHCRVRVGWIWIWVRCR